jgi:hypothetical protein
MIGHVGRGHGMPGPTSDMPGGFINGCSGGGMGRYRRLPGLAHRDFAPRPGSGGFDGLLGTVIVRVGLAEHGQHMLGTIGGPHGEQPMAFKAQRAASMDSDITLISHLLSPRSAKSFETIRILYQYATNDQPRPNP